MSDPQLTEAFFAKAAGWEVMKHARALLASGKVLSSNWTPPLLKGVVVSDATSLRAGLVIRHELDIENVCPCRQSREWGTLCAHSVAVGLHHLKPAPVAPPPVPGTASYSSQRPGAPASPVVTGRPMASNKDPVRLQRSETGRPLEVHVVFPPNLADAIRRDRVMVMFEGLTPSQRAPLNALVKAGMFRLSEADARLLDAAELAAGGDTPGMIQLSGAALLPVLQAMAGHPRLTLGRKTALTVSGEAAPLPLRARLEPSGEITLALKGSPQACTLLAGPDGTWALDGDTLRPLGLPTAVRGVLQGPQKIPRSDVPRFLSQDWPTLSRTPGLEADFRPEDFVLEPAPPRFLLQLSGGLAMLTALLQCRYGTRIMTVGVTARDEAAWMPDPANTRRYLARDLAAEHMAFMRLRQAGFTGPDAQGRWQLNGQERVLAYFSRLHPRLEREWEVSLEERLETSTRKNLVRVQPRFQITPSGERWFDLEVSYVADDGERFSAADIQRLVLGGGQGRSRSGKTVLIDTGAVEELQEVLLDCSPDQHNGRYRMGAAQAGFLDASLREQGHTVQAPAAWRERVARQTGEALPACPPLGALETVLRPYQRQGVAWIGFLRDNGFGGVLADEMGLGKTLQVLAHRASLHGTAATRPAHPTLVVCPTSLVTNWAAEAARFAPDLRVLVISGPQRHKLFARVPEHDLVVTSYALLRRDIEHYRDHAFDTAVLDEAQHIKNRSTQNAKAVKAIPARHRLVLTGTPLENSVLDLWSLFDFLMPGYLGASDDFRERYEVPITQQRDQGSMVRLGKRIRPFLLRRLKKDVLQDLPAKLEHVSYCDLTPAQSTVYAQVLAATRAQVDSAVEANGLAKSRMVLLTALLRLRQICCDLRLLEADGARTADGAEAGALETNAGSNAGASASPDDSGKLQLFGELLDQSLDGGHRLLVFSQFTRMLRLLKDELKRRDVEFCYLDGSTQDRAGEVARFQSPSGPPVFLISLKAGGVGLNLTQADTVVHFDPWWNPAVEDQATDRAHRIGQSRVVSSYKLITRGTVEEKIVALQQRKREIIASTLTGEEAFAESLSWDEIRELLG
ncbi:MAG: DEAD/DEAH box helicase [Verrucomicrobia bacterium]|nr:DEAD/DEAH box helicase [Verrucomicrobiota bacterium]